MAESSSRPEHEPNTTGRNPLSYLGPDSYTLHRLQHATPEHLYLTSRRIFVGPIPEGWLRSHRRDWYRHHLHLGSSSRTLSFSAAPNTGKRKSLTGLDALGKTPQSFPQPGDLSEGHIGQDGDTKTENRPRRTESSVGLPTGTDAHIDGVNEVVSVGEGSRSAFNSVYRAPLSTLRSKQSARAPSKSVRSKMPRHTSDMSFVTAPESMHSSHVPTSKTGDDKQTAISGDPGEETQTPEVRTSTISADSRSDSTTPLLQPKIDDLIKQHEQPATCMPEGGITKQKDVSSKELERPQSRGPDAPGETARRHPAPTTGLVRFDIPAKDTRKDQTIEARSAQPRPREALNRLRGIASAQGQVVRTEKMLVRVDSTSHQLSPEFDENDCPKIEAQTIDKWREFMVVCRESTDDDSEYVLQMYKSRVIPAIERTHVRKRSTYDIALDSKTVKINIFSSLDKTICLWEPYKRGFRIYIMRPRSAASAMSWYTFLRGLLGWQRSSLLSINVPDLSVNLRLDHPFENLESSQSLVEAANGNMDAMAKTVEEEQAVAGNLVARCMEMLERSSEWRDVVDAWALPMNMRTKSDDKTNASSAVRDQSSGIPSTDDQRATSAVSGSPRWSMLSAQDGHAPIGLAWKRYDRLEWIYGAQEKSMYGTIGMEKSHELELRPKMHYPTNIRKSTGELFTEPPPVEGFLIRLTSRKGADQRLRKLYHKRLYFSTHDQFLVFNRPTHADPPPPPQLFGRTDPKVPSAAEIVEQVPLIYVVNPYPVKDGQIDWLSKHNVMSRNAVVNSDEHAFLEVERKTNVLLRCDGFINLLNVVEVRDVHRGAIPVDEQIGDGPDANFHQSVDDTRHEDGEVHNMDGERTFELRLKNDLTIRLQAYDKVTKMEWMNRLRALVDYWSDRATADMALFKSVRRQNLDALHIDEQLEAYIGQFAHKWEVKQSYASPELYHMCGISSCRTIAHSGVLFRKPRMHATFRRSEVLLVHGNLLIFHDTLRSRSGTIRAHIHNERMAAIDLSDCYVYSGLITSNELLYSGSSGYDKSRPGQGSGLPLMFEDGWTSQDDETSLVFVLWHGKKKSWFRSEQTSNTKDGTRSKLKLVSQLGKEGKSVVFKARSRAERDHWVQAISIEIERVAQKEDIRIVEKG